MQRRRKKAPLLLVVEATLRLANRAKVNSLRSRLL
jgi:hypothetical protein